MADMNKPEIKAALALPDSNERTTKLAHLYALDDITRDIQMEFDNALQLFKAASARYPVSQNAADMRQMLYYAARMDIYSQLLEVLLTT